MFNFVFANLIILTYKFPAPQRASAVHVSLFSIHLGHKNPVISRDYIGL